MHDFGTRAKRGGVTGSGRGEVESWALTAFKDGIINVKEGGVLVDEGGEEAVEILKRFIRMEKDRSGNQHGWMDTYLESLLTTFLIELPLW